MIRALIPFLNGFHSSVPVPRQFPPDAIFNGETFLIEGSDQED